MLIVNLDNTVLTVALPTLVRELRATSSQLQWIVDAYALVFAGLLLPASSLADRVGRMRTFLARTTFAAWERASSHPMLNLGVLPRPARPSAGASRGAELPEPRSHHRRYRKAIDQLGEKKAVSL